MSVASFWKTKDPNSKVVATGQLSENVDVTIRAGQRLGLRRREPRQTDDPNKKYPVMELFAFQAEEQQRPGQRPANDDDIPF